MNYYTLDRREDIILKYVNFRYKKQIEGGKDQQCIRDFFIFLESPVTEKLKEEDEVKGEEPGEFEDEKEINKEVNSSPLVKYTLYSVICILLML